MRILIDTNILFSTLLFPKSKPAYALLYAANNHQIVLTDRNIFELREIIKRKKPNLLPAAETFLAQLSFELIPAVEDTAKTIRDVKDQPIKTNLYLTAQSLRTSISFLPATRTF